ncbi:caspase family protein [Rubinisphaera italica]|uniref:Caspase domain protein n=1 Tax=Rubinisphaera italica TaxID=2527969 RepID=A0A5C5XCK6_9PLAN|nr:caspase family protein [Rubinisphaera italica]TWT60887.1 Caspase domain protein [Rubinisphaera italica]
MRTNNRMMSYWSSVIFTGILFLVAVSSCFAQNDTENTNPPKFALLIGVGNYQSEEITDLDGCRNDVEALHDVLVTRFGFDSDRDIITLIDEQATALAIRQAMQTLVQKIKALPEDSPASQVIFHYSGHGSQVYDQLEGPLADEPEDGLDETLVPYDAVVQGSETDIRDDELNQFAQSICADNRTRLWIILDSCHSGTAARGTTKVRRLDRQLKPVPSSQHQTVQKSETTLPQNAVALYACLSHQQEPEYPDGGKTFGLLSRFLVQVLNEKQSVSKLSYEMLVDEIISRYRLDHKTMAAPTPRVEGNLRSIVCGADRETDIPQYWITLADGNRKDQVILRAGSLHGLSVGSLYLLYERPEQIFDQSAEPLSWLKVVEVAGTTARAEVLQRFDEEFDSFRLPASFEQGFAVEQYHHYGDYKTCLQLEFVETDSGNIVAVSAEDSRVPESLRELFNTSSESETNWLRPASQGESGDLILRIDGHYAALFPITGFNDENQSQPQYRTSIPSTLRGGWGDAGEPFDLRTPLKTLPQINQCLRRITRARNLIRISEENRSRQNNTPAVRLQLDRLAVEISDGQAEIVGRSPWNSTSDLSQPTSDDVDRTTSPLIVQEDDYYDWSIISEESGTSPYYITILQIDANMGIQTMLPWQRGDQAKLIYPGETLQIGGFQLVSETGEDARTVFGPRWTILLATREENYFSMLEQDSLPNLRSSGINPLSSHKVKNNSPSSLAEILLQETYFVTRGDRPLFQQKTKQYDTSWTVDIVQWIAMPQKKRISQE